MVFIQMGDHGAFSALVQRHTQRFYAAAYRVCQNPGLSEDIVQEAFLKLWGRPELWDPDKGAKFTTWFYRVVSNLAVDHMRKVKVSGGDAALEFIADDRVDQYEELAMSDQQRALERAIASLPERQKLALNLCFYEGLSNKEAAHVLDIGVKALESLLVRAKASVKDELKRVGVLDDDEQKGASYG